MNRLAAALLSSLLITTAAHADSGKPVPAASGDITVRTENYPRPQSSGATYFFYERNGKVICTELEVCTMFGQCEFSYSKGSVKAAEDAQKAPATKSAATVIPKFKLDKHVCLTKYKLL